MTDHNIGVDISKAHFDAFDLKTGRAAQFTNGKTGFRSFRKWLGGRKIARIVYEATGTHHRAFELALEADFPLVKGDRSVKEPWRTAGRPGYAADAA